MMPGAVSHAAAQDNPVVVMQTSMGDITIELFQDQAPISVENFLQYANDGYYAGTVFHRVIQTFMIQGGGMTADLSPKQTRAPIKNEATNGVSNARGTIAMARTNVVDSATSQFFINTVDNRSLDHRDRSARGFGYAVFGEVADGMDVVERIERTRTHSRNGLDDVPRDPIIIIQIRRLD
jgi:cyclophilin family peptidyl-prolyl cis-trans isomerase